MPQIRGLTTFRGFLHAVRGNTLHRIDSAGNATTLGTINSTGGPVDFAQTAQQLGISDGSQLFVYDGTTLQESPDYVPGARIAVIDQRLFFDHRNTQVFGYANLNNMLVIDADDIYSAEKLPDNLKAVVEVYGELLMLGQNSGEVWSGVGGLEVVARNESALIEFGTDAPHSLQKAGGSCMWLGRSERGQMAVIQLKGYQAVPVSTRAIEERFEGLDVSRARAYVRLRGKRECYYLNCPRLDTTLVYDTVFKQWHEEAELVNGQYKPARATCTAFAYGRHYVGANDGNLYEVRDDAHDFAGDVKCRDRISPVVANPEFDEMRFPHFEVLCKKATTATVMLRYSDDNGHTWSNWRTESAGAVGAYHQRVRYEQLGQARDRVYQVRVTDNAPFNPVTVDVGVRRP